MFFEDLLGILCSLTTSRVSEALWAFYPHLIDMFRREGIDYFSDFVPVLYNYISVRQSSN